MKKTLSFTKLKITGALYKGAGAALLGIFLLANILFSQKTPALFSSLLEGRKEAVIDYLKKTKNLPFFDKELLLYKNRYGSSVETAVFENREKRKERIGELEEELKKNKNARDVLFNLYILYKEEGMDKEADAYFQMAQKIDPLLKGE